MTTARIPNSDMANFTDEELKRAEELLGCKLDRGNLLRALIFQRDAGLSIARGEIGVVSFNGKPRVEVTKNGYLAYASRQPEYDGYESGFAEDEIGGRYAWCKVYIKGRGHIPANKVYFKEEMQEKAPIWKQRPLFMMEKVAIKRAHKDAFASLCGNSDDTESISEESELISAEPVAGDESVFTEDYTKNPSKVYTNDQAESIKQNMIQRGMFVGDVFERARLDDTLMDGDMIDEHFRKELEKQQQELEKQYPEV
ncbi:MAG TPA: recombinase RecT [Methanocorpusculum sp.]|nr:recombinase RecT [Methanocorpusculum sp.]HJJ39969.1 recombinase RecT [Methanocorpusculum sp.]HJJ49453.1 recombinase RecT [Methanocorpusculum sp.]HJJ57004.1 recombinase RecT [Methanocorpusculum sp.]